MKSLLLVLMLITASWAQEELMTNVTIKPLVHYQAGSTDGSPIFLIDSAGVDTSKAYLSFKWSGVTLHVKGDSSETFIKVVAQCGNNYGTVPIGARCDSLDINLPGNYVWQINLPISQWFRIIFEADSTATDSVRIDSSFVNRNW